MMGEIMLSHRAAAVAAALVLAAGGPIFAQEKQVNVYNWSDYIDDAVLKEFEKETGIKVVYDTFDSNEVLETKLLTGNSGYDVVVPTVSFMPRQIEAGALQKLDRSKIPNWNNYSTEIAQRSAVYDPDNAFGVTYMWFPTGIGYNVAKVKERLGDQPIDTWDVVFNPDKLAKLADCGVYFLDSPEDVMSAALKYLGKDPNTRDAEEIKAAADMLAKVRPSVKKFHSSEYINALANGDICVAIGWAGDVYQAKDRAAEAGKGVEVNFVVPREGTLVSMDTLAIPADAKNVDEAHALINFLLRPEIAARNTNATNFANAVLSSRPMVDEGIRNDPAIYVPDDVLAKLYTVQPYDAKLQRSVTRLWTRLKSGR
jgi:putrescine transport system substrate-binding protein